MPLCPGWDLLQAASATPGPGPRDGDESPRLIPACFEALLELFLPWDPSMSVTPTLGPRVCNDYLLWAIWIPRAWFISIDRNSQSFKKSLIKELAVHHMGVPITMVRYIPELTAFGSSGYTLPSAIHSRSPA